MIKISSDEGREDCQQLKPKGTQASLGTTVIAVTILLILSILFSRVTVNALVFLLCIVFYMKLCTVWGPVLGYNKRKLVFLTLE